MAAVTRWVLYDTTSAGVAGTGGGTNRGRGTRGYSIATASVSDSFNIGTNNNRLYVNVDGAGTQYVTLASGTDLDPRFVAKDITEKIHNLGMAATGWNQAQCVWDDNQFKLYSGTLGTSSQVAVSSGTNTAHLELGWGTKTEVGGSATNNANADNYITVSGTYKGLFDEIYHIVINKEVSIGTPSKGGSNTYTGTITVGGVYNYASDITYTISISTTNGTTMGAGTGNVPTMSWTSTSSVDDSSSPVELLYANYWYKLGSKGVMVKFSDAIFNTCNPAWTVACSKVQYAQGTNANAPIETAKFVWGSNRGDDATTASTTHSGSWSELGSRGVYVSFAGAGANLTAGDEFFVVCTPPQPSSYDISNLNYGNVTVSTESPVRSVLFEILSGAVEISTVKFGLQSHGTFQHHGQGNDDTYFRFGTVGPGNNAGTSPVDGIEWQENIVAADIDNDVHPSYLYATKENLSVVADADSSESLGVSAYAGMVADPVWLNIKLGTAEVGANSTINYRIYFDYA